MATAGNNLSSYKSEDLPNGAHFKVGIVVSTWNQTYTGGMLEGGPLGARAQALLHTQFHARTQEQAAASNPMGIQW